MGSSLCVHVFANRGSLLSQPPSPTPLSTQLILTLQIKYHPKQWRNWLYSWDDVRTCNLWLHKVTDWQICIPGKHRLLTHPYYFRHCFLSFSPQIFPLSAHLLLPHVFFLSFWIHTARAAILSRCVYAPLQWKWAAIFFFIALLFD